MDISLVSFFSVKKKNNKKTKDPSIYVVGSVNVRAYM